MSHTFNTKEFSSVQRSVNDILFIIRFNKAIHVKQESVCVVNWASVKPGLPRQAACGLYDFSCLPLAHLVLTLKHTRLNVLLIGHIEPRSMKWQEERGRPVGRAHVKMSLPHNGSVSLTPLQYSGKQQWLLTCFLFTS